MKRKYLLVIIAILLLTPFILKKSLANENDVLTSNTYVINNNAIYAIPTSSNFNAKELLRNIESIDKIEIYNTNNEIINNNDSVWTGYRLKTSNITYNIVVLGDVTGDGSISLGDVSALYNHYKNNRLLNALKLEAGLLTKNNNVTLGDVSKLYNYYKGKKPFTYYTSEDIDSINNYIEQAIQYKINNPNSNKIGTNIINELNISDKTDSDQIVITKDNKVELAFLRNNFCYRKSALSDEIEIIEGKLCKADIINYPSNSGQLHISGSNIIDDNNHEVLLRGTTIPTVYSLTDDNPSKNSTSSIESLHTLRNWGANCVRIFAPADNGYAPGFNNNPDEFITQLKKIIDMAIENDMYVVVNWDPARNDGASFTEQARDCLTRIANLYPNDPHIIYEIWNEPESVNTWEQVSMHADAVIPSIRAISPNAIILVGSPGFDSQVLNIEEHLLNYDNIMYTYHTYMGTFRGENIERLIELKEKGIPVFISEWGCMSVEANTRLVFDELAEAYAKIAYKNKISNLLFAFGESEDYDNPWGNKYGIVLTGKWEAELPNRILKINGKFMKTALSNNYQDFKTNLLRVNNNANGRDYRSDEYREKIISIEFKTTLNIPSEAVKTWDLSQVQDESIIGYLLPTANNMYKLIIAANGPINAPSNSDYLFSRMPNLENINFDGFTTKYVVKLNHIFDGDSKIETLDVSNFDTTFFRELWAAFGSCTNLKNVNLNEWNLDRVDSIGDMFWGCKNLESIDLTNWNVEKVKNLSKMFYNNTKLKTVNLSTWNPNKITTIKEMFKGCTSLENVDISLLNIDENTDVTDALNNVKENSTFIVKNQYIVDKLQPTTTTNVNYYIK